MSNASYVQSNFQGGEWSPAAQGRVDEPTFKTALNVCVNGYPRVNGAWTRRQGFMYMAHTRMGLIGRLIDLEFSFSDAYQIEFTNGYIRFYKANAIVFTSDANVVIASISAANPAVVTVTGTLPTAWATGDTVMLNLSPPCTCPILGSRQFVIKVLTTTTFSIFDALTGASIDGSTFTYTPVSGTPDNVYKILEFQTPYTNGQWQSVRLIKTDTTAVTFHLGVQPYSLNLSGGTWTFSPQAFQDGPYLDINETTTTLTPGAVSGNTTVTASSVVGINNGLGFVQTDVGRMIRLLTGPPAWAIGTTYAKDAIVLGSDNNIYTSVTGGNVGNDPTTDTGANWQISSQTIIWGWMMITSVTSSTVVNVTIFDASNSTGTNLFSTAATSSWQLGYFSDTTGWPTNGVYHEGRLWIGGGITPNRYDASMSNNVFVFSPSAFDGTVADNNGISATLNAPDANVGYWMLTTPQGILVGTRAGEWLIAASALNDPITPTSIQAHRVSQYGCANIEPLFASLTTVFIQRQQRKVMDYAQYPYGEAAGWYAEDLTMMADHVTNGGIQEIRWQQEPNRMIYGRKADGSLVSCTFQHAPYGKPSFSGWARHPLGGGRTVVSLSSGPTFDALSTTMYAIVNDPNTGYYHAVALSPVFDDSVPGWASVFADGVASPSCSQVKDVAVGDAYSGIRFNGLYNIAGQLATVVIGGMDLGDFTVNAGGYIDVPYTATFTASFLNGLNNGTDYSVYQIQAAAPAYNTYASNAIGMYTDNGANLSSTADFAIDEAKNWFFYVAFDRIVRCNLKTLAWEATVTTSQLFGGNPNSYSFGSNGFCYHPGNNKIFIQQAGNSTPLWVIDATTMSLVTQIGTFNSGFQTHKSPLNITSGFNTSLPLQIRKQNLYIHTGISSAGNNNEVSIWDADTLNLYSVTDFADSQVWLGFGAKDTGNFYAIGTPNLASPGTTVGVNVYACNATSISGFGFGTPAFTKSLFGSITPAQIDATWTHILSVLGPGFDPTDGNLLLYFTTGDSVTNKSYWVKVNSATAAIIWKLADVTYPGTTPDLVFANLSGGVYNYANEGASGVGYKLGFYSLNLSAGTLSTTYSSANLATMVTLGPQLPYNSKNSIIMSGNWTNAGYNPTFLNSYASGGGQSWYLVTLAGSALAANWPPPDLYKIPASIGVTYTSQGQLLRPDQGQEAGAANGPAFGKFRRVHKFAVYCYRSQNFTLGTDFSANSHTIQVQDKNGTPTLQPNLYTGILRDTLDHDYDTEGQVAWQVTRPTPLTIGAIGGFIATQDE